MVVLVLNCLLQEGHQIRRFLVLIIADPMTMALRPLHFLSASQLLFSSCNDRTASEQHLKKKKKKKKKKKTNGCALWSIDGINRINIHGLCTQIALNALFGCCVVSNAAFGSDEAVW